MIHVAILRGDALEQGGVELLDSWSDEEGTSFWIDIESSSNDEVEPLLEGRFHFHELAAEDALSENTLPKYDPFEQYDFFIFRAVAVNLSHHVSETVKVAAFLGARLLVTVHAGPMGATRDIWSRLPSDRRLLAKGPDFLLYSIIDILVDAHFPLIDEIEECVDKIQDEIFGNPDPAHLDELLRLKRDVNMLRRYSLPQRELLNQISRGDAKFVQAPHLIYFRDVYDHMFRISESIDVERDMMAGTMEAYLSVVANRTNEVMKVLTVFSAIMLPLTLIAGIYGMNFDHMPELRWHFGYFYALSLMAVIGVSMLITFWRMGWIGRGPRVRRHKHDGASSPSTAESAGRRDGSVTPD